MEASLPSLSKKYQRKQKLAEQEKVLETQKLVTVLKEQELVSIDAMIEGQEKNVNVLPMTCMTT